MGDIPPLMQQASDERNRVFFELVADFEIFRYQIASLFHCYTSNDTVNYSFQDLNEKSYFQKLKYSVSKFLSGSGDKNDKSDSNTEEQLEQQTMMLRKLKKQMQVLVEKTAITPTNNDGDSD